DDAPMEAHDAFTLASLLAGQSLHAPQVTQAPQASQAPQAPIPSPVASAGDATAWEASQPSGLPGRGPEGASLAAHQVGLGLARAASDSLVGETVALDGAADAAGAA